MVLFGLMAKATLVLTNGTTVTLEGDPDEVHRLLQLYGEAAPAGGTGPRSKKARPKRSTGAPDVKTPASKQREEGVDHSGIINLIKTCDEAEDIERQILDRTGMVNRTLLPLYIVHEHLDNAFGLTSGDVKKITTDLGIPVSQSNASTTLSKTAARYVIGDTVRKKGVPVRYKLSRRGVQYLQGVIAGTSNEG